MNPRPRPRTRMPATERRQQIITVATTLIAERGYWGLSVQDVADACGLTVNGVLHHVGSKDGLLLAVLTYRDEADARALGELLDLAPEEVTGPDAAAAALARRGGALGTLCEALVQRNAAQPEIVRLYSVLEAESLTPDHPAHAYFQERQHKALRAIADLAPDGVDAGALAHVVLAVMDGLQLQWLRDPSMDLITSWRSASRTIPAMA